MLEFRACNKCIESDDELFKSSPHDESSCDSPVDESSCGSSGRSGGSGVNGLINVEHRRKLSNYICIDQKSKKSKLSLTRFPVSNPWLHQGGASALKPSSLTAGEVPPPPLIPPDPPDHASPFSPQNYPPLGSSPNPSQKSKLPTFSKKSGPSTVSNSTKDSVAQSPISTTLSAVSFGSIQSAIVDLETLLRNPISSLIPQTTLPSEPTKHPLSVSLYQPPPWLGTINLRSPPPKPSQKTPAKGKSKNKHKEVLKASTSTPTADLEVNNMPPSSTAVEVVTDNVLQDLNSSHSSLLFTYVHKKKHSFSKKKASTKKPSHTITAPSSPKKNLSPSDFMEKKKLKRTRSDPSFDSPPHQSTCTHLHYHSA
ncbi:hypothetical protein YC2023_081986 [Brassica napus]